MHKYFLKRIVLLIPVLLAVSFVIFALMAMAPGDPGSAILGASAPPEAIQEFNESVGFYDPFFVRYADFLKDLIHLDFGDSYVSKAPVMDEIAKRLPTTIQVATYSMLVAVLVGVPLGVLSAVKQYSLADSISRVLAITLTAVPFFWLGLMLIYWFALKIPIFPSFGVGSLKHYVLPCVSLGLTYAARELRMTRSCMLETLRMDYIRTTRAKGSREKTVIWRHAFKNALLPIITMIGSHFGALLGGAILTESVFSIPGLGTYLISSIRGKDMPAVLGTAMVLAIMFCLVMLVVDLLYAMIDPRIKAKFAK